MAVGKQGVGSPSEDGAGHRREKIRAHVMLVLQKWAARHVEVRRDEFGSTPATSNESQGA